MESAPRKDACATEFVNVQSGNLKQTKEEHLDRLGKLSLRPGKLREPSPKPVNEEEFSSNRI